MESKHFRSRQKISRELSRAQAEWRDARRLAAAALDSVDTARSEITHSVGGVWLSADKMERRFILSINDDAILYGDHGDGEEYQCSYADFLNWVRRTDAFLENDVDAK